MRTLRSNIRRALDVLAKAGLDIRPILRRVLGRVRSRAEMARWLAENPVGQVIDSRDTGFSSPGVSITMASRNRAHCIGDAIRSVQAQSFADWELIVIDDGSTDGTCDTVASFAGDPRIRYVWQPPLGMAKARNHGLRLARGALIAYLDDDNLLYPDFLAAAVDTFSRKPDVDCLYGALVADMRSDGGPRISCDRFDRERLVRQNFIDMGQLVHRHELIERYGGMDESLECACDWDLVLRLTREKPAYRLPVLAIRYRTMDKNRISDTRPSGLDYLKVRRKWFAVLKTPRLPRVLYVLSHDARLSDGHVETEIRCMRRWGVDVEAWSKHEVAGPDESSVPVHRGDLGDAIAEVNPDVLHVHGLHAAIAHSEVLAAAGLPVTAWAPDFRAGAADNQVQQLLTQCWMRRIYHPSPRLADVDGSPKLRRQTAAFDTSLFRPAAAKDRRLVLLRTSAALARWDLPFFVGLASCVPDHRFVLAVATGSRHGADVEEMVAHWRQVGTPGELLVGVPRDELVSLIERAGLYLHTVAPADQGDASPIGMPTSIAEAMATGGHILVRDRGALVEYVGDAGRAYRDMDHAAALIRASAKWSDDEWHRALLRSVNRSFSNFADELALRPLFEDWCNILAECLTGFRD
jgi:glycosyltransferase involved in cell wall biosynthesis